MKIGHAEQANASNNEANSLDLLVACDAACHVVANPTMKDYDTGANHHNEDPTDEPR